MCRQSAPCTPSCPDRVAFKSCTCCPAPRTCDHSVSLPSVCELCAMVKRWDVLSFRGRRQTDYGVEAGYVSIIFFSSSCIQKLLCWSLSHPGTEIPRAPASGVAGSTRGGGQPRTCLQACSAPPGLALVASLVCPSSEASPHTGSCGGVQSPRFLVFTCSLLPGTPQPCPPRAPALHPQCTVSWGLPGWSWASGPGRLGTRCLQLSRSVSGAALKEPACSLHRFFRTEGVSGSRLRGPGTTPALSRPQRPSREFTALQEGLRDSMALANVE